MNETPSLDDLSLFLTVADSGSLSAAARYSGIPLPTLSRRMGKLETALGRALFLRGPAGYTLTAEGRALADRIADLRGVRRKLALWQGATAGPVAVRITAGFWTSRHLATTLRPADTPLWCPAFVPSNAALDIARREADIGIRNQPPASTRLAIRRLRRIDYAVYGTGPGITGFVTLPENLPAPPSQRWLRAHHGDQITTTASDTRLCLDLALSGFGRIVMPCFAGDAEPGLLRLSDPITEISHEEWLVSHHEARHDPPVRAALTAIAAALTQSTANPAPPAIDSPPPA